MNNFKFSSKGAGDAISTLILFIAVISISVGIVIAFQQFVTQTQVGLENQQDILSSKLNTQYIISNIIYDSSVNITTLYVKNTGNTQLDVNSLSFFIADEYITSATIVNANTGGTIRIFSPQDTILVNSSIDLPLGVYEVRVISEFGNIVEDTFVIE